jgi:hypothetical protein
VLVNTILQIMVFVVYDVVRFIYLSFSQKWDRRDRRSLQALRMRRRDRRSLHALRMRRRDRRSLEALRMRV